MHSPELVVVGLHKMAVNSGAESTQVPRFEALAGLWPACWAAEDAVQAILDQLSRLAVEVGLEGRAGVNAVHVDEGFALHHDEVIFQAQLVQDQGPGPGLLHVKQMAGVVKGEALDELRADQAAD